MANEIVKTVRENADDALVKLSRVVGEDGRVDVSSLSPEAVARCREITRHVKDEKTLSSFGIKLESTKSECSAKLLEMNKIDKAGPVGGYIQEIVDVINESQLADPDKLTGWKKFVAKLPFIGVPAAARVDKLIQKHESAKKTIGRVSDSLATQQADLFQDYNTLDEIQRKTVSYIEQLGMDYVALAQLFKDTEDEYNKMLKENEETPGKWSDQELIAKKRFLEKIDERGHQLFMAAQYNGHILLPQIQKMKDNTEILASSAENIRNHVLPEWETSIAIAIIDQRSEEIAESQKLIKDMHNKMIVQNAENMKNITIKVEENAMRDIIDLDAYRQANTSVVEALKTSAQNIREAAQKRAEARAEISRINKETSEELRGIAKDLEEMYGTGQAAITADELK